jgi:hypothetical protein
MLAMYKKCMESGCIVPSHELSALYFGTGCDDLGLSRTLGLGGHGQRILQFLVKDQIFDEHRLDFNTPAGRGLFDDLADGLCNLLTALDNILEDTGTDHVTKCCLCTLDESLADVGNAESGPVRGGDAVVDDRGELQRNVILGHADLLGNFDNLDLDINLDKLLGERVDVDKTRVDSAGKSTELSYQANVSLVHGLVRVRAADAAGNSTKGTDDSSKSIDLSGVSCVSGDDQMLNLPFHHTSRGYQHQHHLAR